MDSIFIQQSQLNKTIITTSLKKAAEFGMASSDALISATKANSTLDSRNEALDLIISWGPQTLMGKVWKLKAKTMSCINN